MEFLVVGAGFSGSVVARLLAEAGHRAHVVDGRSHVAGNCHTSRDGDSGVMVHRYGPHLFHTRSSEVAEFVQRFGRWIPNQHRVRATTTSGVYAMPLNLLSMNQFFGTRHGPQAMRQHVAALASWDVAGEPRNFEEQALSMMGAELYEEFFRGYTAKQWGRSPTELPASVLKRLPMRFVYDDRYFSDPFEALPEQGYTSIVEAILDHPSIVVELGTPLSRADGTGFDHVIWTGPIDAYFEHVHGPLAYRTLDFEWHVVDGPFQGCSVMNYCEERVDYTRIAEHNYFSPWEEHRRAVIAYERSREAEIDDIPYYPIRLADDQTRLDQYLGTARAASGVTFLGRLGTYRYLDMDTTIEQAMQAARTILGRLAAGERLPTFGDESD